MSLESLEMMLSSSTNKLQIDKIRKEFYKLTSFHGMKVLHSLENTKGLKSETKKALKEVVNDFMSDLNEVTQ